MLFIHNQLILMLCLGTGLTWTETIAEGTKCDGK